MTIDLADPTTFHALKPHEVAQWLERIYHDNLKQDPRHLRLDSRRSTAGNFDKSAIHVTEAVDECPRRAVLRLLANERGEEPEEEESQNWAHEGFMKEEWARAILRKEFPRLYTANLPVPIGYGIQGFYDRFSRKLLHVDDVKSVGWGALDRLPIKKHMQQVATYGAFLSAYVGAEVRATLTYIPRDDISGLRVYAVPYDGDTVRKSFMKRATFIRQHVDLGLEPPIPDHLDGSKFPCTWKNRAGETQACRFYEKCWKTSKVKQPVPAPEEVERLLVQAAATRDAKLLYEQGVKDCEAEIKTIQAQVQPFFEEVDAKVEVPGVGAVALQVNRPTVAYDPEAALRARPELEARLKPFRTKIDIEAALKGDPDLKAELEDFKVVTRKGSSFLRFPRKGKE